jgi:hypothetical protein
VTSISYSDEGLDSELFDPPKPSRRGIDAEAEAHAQLSSMRHERGRIYQRRTLSAGMIQQHRSKRAKSEAHIKPSADLRHAQP